MDDGLRSVRARCAYWEKRLDLEPVRHKRLKLAQFAWAEILRLVIHHGAQAHGGLTALQELAQEQFAVSLATTESRLKKSPKRRARAAATGRSKDTA